MFDILFGWRKASKCKKLIKLVQCRLKLLKNKRYAIVRQLRKDVGQLIKTGHEQIAFNRVEQIIKDESIAAVYELLDHFCEFILLHLSYIRRNKDCPNDINEAVSSLVFASARCGDLPELRAIRKLFGERYGQRFAMTAVELFPGNLVNREIKEKLSIKSIPDDMKQRMVDEIAKDYCQKPEILALEYYPEWQQQQLQVKENSGHQVLDTDVQTNFDRIGGPETQSSNVEGMERKIYVDSTSTSKKFFSGVCDLPSHQDSNITSTSIVLLSSPTVVESPRHNKAEKVENCAKLNSPYKYTISGLEHKGMRTTAASSSESLPQFSEEMVVYLDDIEEFQSSTTKDGDCQDQRLFKFRSSALAKSGKVEVSFGQTDVDHYESLSEKSGSRSSRKSGKTSGKRLRRRSLSWENRIVKDVEYVLYYDKPCKSSPNHLHRKHQKKTLVVEREQTYYAQKRLKKPCCLEHPFYSCTCDDKDSWEVLPWKQNRGITTFVGFPTHRLEREIFCGECHHCCFRNEESDNIPQKPRRRNHDNGATVYNVFTYQDRQPNKQNKETKGEAGRSNASGSCSSSSVSYQRVPPYSRAETMPQERPKQILKESMVRFNSFPFQLPNHVHPKLPEYEDLAAKFMALKKEHTQNKDSGSNRQHF